MVMMSSSLEKVPSVGAKLPSVPRDPKLGISADDGNVSVHRTTLSRSINHHQKMLLDQRPLVGVIAAQNESSLFSSSLSELVNHKLWISSNKLLSRQPFTLASEKDEVDPFKSQEEPESQTINNLLPDEEELFSGMVDELGLNDHPNNNGSDDLEDFDVFTCGGGIELEPDDRLPVDQRNMSYSWGGLHGGPHSVRPVSRLPNGMVLGDASPHENSHILNGFHSQVNNMPTRGGEFGVSEAAQAFHHVAGFHPRSPQVQVHNVGNIIQHNSLDAVAGIGDNIGLKVPNKGNLDINHLGLNGHAMDINEGGFGYSPNGIPMHQSLASKSNSYQQHLRSFLMANSPSFQSTTHAHHLGTLPSSPGASHLMMNMVSPVQQLQVGSAPVLKASLWDRQPVYVGESRDTPGYQMGGVRSSIGIPGFSPSSVREIASHGSLPRAHGNLTEMSKSSKMHSPQRMGHMFHERSPMNSLPTSFVGSPSERVRSRRNEANLSHADRKHYELNLDRILRGEDTRTTLMIKNIPNKYTSKMLLATIDEQHRGKYDFIYLPIDFKNKCNMGYAFINMVDPLQIVAFHKTFEGRKWEKFNSEKVATLAYARIQGKGALIAHFQNSSLMNEDKRCRPILFHTDGPNAGDQEPFPMGTGFRPKPGRLQVPTGEEDE